MSRIFIGIGSNQGDRLALMSKAVKLLNAGGRLRVTRIAPIIETDPVGGPPQPPYLNTVAEGETPLSPQDTLALLQAVERELGRVASPVKWAPRPIDLDLLFYESHVIRQAGLIIPHPRLHERAFVLEPLAQLAPEFVPPRLGETVGRRLVALERSSHSARTLRPAGLPRFPSGCVGRARALEWCRQWAPSMKDTHRLSAARRRTTTRQS
jgi:2-amino-4-hydroxy-6-hydroxymethyldihydropteridine diphosphokinase